MSTDMPSPESVFLNYSRLITGPFGDDIAMPLRTFDTMRSDTALERPTDLYVGTFGLDYPEYIAIPAVELADGKTVDEVKFEVEEVGVGYRLGWVGRSLKATIPMDPKEALRSANTRLVVRGTSPDNHDCAVEIRAVGDSKNRRYGAITVRTYFAGSRGVVLNRVEFPSDFTTTAGEQPGPHSIRTARIAGAVIGFIAEQAEQRNLFPTT